jgi:hypothetical protein
MLRCGNCSSVGTRKDSLHTRLLTLYSVGYIYQPPTGPSAGPTTASGPLTSDPWWGVVAAWSFVVTQWFKVPPAVSIVLGGVAGLAWFGVVGESGVMRE